MWRSSCRHGDYYAKGIKDAVRRGDTIFTDLTGGERHEVDVIAKVKFRDKDAFFLFHAEPQSRSRGGFPRRMFHYLAWLDEKNAIPIYPVAIFTFDAPRRAEEDRYQRPGSGQTRAARKGESYGSG